MIPDAIGRVNLAWILLIFLSCTGCGRATQAPAQNSGATAATATSAHFDTLVVRLLRTMGDGRSGEVGQIERPLAQYRERPVTLLVRKTQQADKALPSPAHFEQRFEVGSEIATLPPLDVDCSKPAACPEREWFELELRGPGGATRKIERPLYDKATDNVELPGKRRYTIVAIEGTVSQDEVKARIGQIERSKLSLEQRKSKFNAIKDEAQNASPDQLAPLIARMDELDPGVTNGTLIALGFAADSDALTLRLAEQSNISIDRSLPRILITSEETNGDQGNVRISLDLRLDEVGASSPEGPTAVKLFQHARGVQESALEGTFMKTIAGAGTAVSTAYLMASGAAAHIPEVVLSADNRAEIAQFAWRPPFAKLVNSALDMGHWVVIPKRVVNLAGRVRWGYWDIDPQTGVTVGVMEGGQHQAMLEMPLLNKKVSQNPKMGWALGFMEGCISFNWALEGGILKYGGVTPALIQEIKKLLAEVACTSICLGPKGEVKVSAAVNGCKGDFWKKTGVKITEDLCEQYKKGFECAAGTMMAHLTGKMVLEDKGEAKGVLFGCLELKSGVSIEGSQAK